MSKGPVVVNVTFRPPPIRPSGSHTGDGAPALAHVRLVLVAEVLQGGLRSGYTAPSASAQNALEQDVVADVAR